MTKDAPVLYSPIIAHDSISWHQDTSHLWVQGPHLARIGYNLVLSQVVDKLSGKKRRDLSMAVIGF